MIQTLLTLLVAFYALSLVAWQVIRQTPAMTRWYLALLEIFDVWLYLPLLPLVVLVALVGQRAHYYWLAIPVLLFAWEYGPLFTPQVAPPAETQLRVMTWNSLWENEDPQPLLAALREHQPDVIALQEYGALSHSLPEALRASYPYQALSPDAHYGTLGMAIYSRYPILASGPAQMGPGTCSCQEAILEVGGQAVRLLNIHPFPPHLALRWLRAIPVPVTFNVAPQTDAIQAVRARVASWSQPGVVVGDLNTSDRQRNYALLRQVLHDAHRKAGWGFGYTFPVGFRQLPIPPFVRIDYVFYTDHWEALGAWTGTIEGSDHRFVIADLVLRPAPELTISTH